MSVRLDKRSSPGSKHLVVRAGQRLGALATRRPAPLTAVGTLLAVGVLLFVVAGRRGQFASAPAGAPWWALTAAAALRTASLLSRTKAWNVCVRAAGGTVGRRRLYRAAGVGYLGNIANGELGFAAPIASLRRAAPGDPEGGGPRDHRDPHRPDGTLPRNPVLVHARRTPGLAVVDAARRALRGPRRRRRPRPASPTPPLGGVQNRGLLGKPWARSVSKIGEQRGSSRTRREDRFRHWGLTDRTLVVFGDPQPYASSVAAGPRMRRRLASRNPDEQRTANSERELCRCLRRGVGSTRRMPALQASDRRTAGRRLVRPSGNSGSRPAAREGSNDNAAPCHRLNWRVAVRRCTQLDEAAPPARRAARPA